MGAIPPVGGIPVSTETRESIAELIGEEWADDFADPETVTAAELGEWLGLTANRVHALGRDSVLPRTAEKTYPLRASVAAYCEHARQLAKGKAADKALAEEKIRLAREQADKIALQNAAARGELLDSRQVANEWSSMLKDIRSSILALPDRLSAALPDISKSDIAAAKNEVRELLQALSEERFDY